MRSAIALLFALSLFASVARAQGSDTPEDGASLAAPTDEQAPADDAELLLQEAALLDARLGHARDGRVERLQAWGSIGIFSGTVAPTIVSAATTLRGADVTVVAPSLGMRLALSDEFDVAAEWALAYGLATVRGDYDGDTSVEAFEGQRERVEAGNPTMRFGWSHAWSSLVLQIGLGASFPAAALAQAATDTNTAMDRAASVLVHETMLAMHGGLDPWRFLPERLSFMLPVRITMGDRLGGAVEIAGAWSIPVLGSGSGVGSEAALQVAGEIGYEVIPELRVGVSGSIVAWRLGSSAARNLVALEPWVRATFGPAFLVVRGTANVGGDYGLGGASGVWAIHVGGGASLDAPSR